MATQGEITLTKFRNHIIQALYIYRCGSAQQIGKLVYCKKDITKSNEKFTYGELSKLIEDGLVEAYKPQPRVYKYSVYYLTKKGLTYAQNLLDLDIGQKGDGWIPLKSEYPFGYFDYEVYSPPLDQILHHASLIDFFIEIAVSHGKTFTHRNNLYAARKTWANHKLRMDAEVLIGEVNYAIEIDRGTESHTQLLQKFKGYATYFSQLADKGMDIDVKNIVFVISGERERTGGLKRRWTNILAAFYKGMGKWAFEVDLHLTSINAAYEFFDIERIKQSLVAEKLHTHAISGIALENAKLYRHKNEIILSGIEHFIQEEQYYLVSFVHEFSTCVPRFYNKLVLKKFKGSYLFHISDTAPNYNYDLQRYEVDANVLVLYAHINKSVIYKEKLTEDYTPISLDE